MDFYPDAGPGVSAAQLQLQAWHIASSPPGFLRNGYLPRLSSIPEGPAEERRAVSQRVQQDRLQHGRCIQVSSSSVASVGAPAACHDVLQLLLVHPSIAAEKQQVQQQQLAGDSSVQLAAHEDAAATVTQQQDSASSPFYHGSRRSSISSISMSMEGAEEEAVAAAAAPVGEDAAAPGDLTAAASTWAMEIRHFTDCLPITPDSVCSSSTYLSLTGAQQHAQKQQQQQVPQHPLRHSSQAAAAIRTCSLPRSSSSASLPQRCSSDDDAAAAATEAALQASFAALQELDDLEWCPWDRVAKWLDSHAAAAAGEQQPQRHGSSSDTALGSGGSSSLHLASSSRLTAAAEVSAGEQQQGADGEPVFDAPAWWQEAVLERLEQQRQAFHGSWWSKARVLASLAATRAACALQI